MTIHQLLADLDPTYWEFWLGAVLVIVILFARDGIMGGVRVLGRWMDKRGAVK